MNFTFGSDVTHDIKISTQKEWLETNGIGGYASSTLPFLNTRKYHGILVAALHPPVGRTVLVSKWVETLMTDKTHYELDCNFFGTSVHPHGYTYLSRFEKDCFPHFIYQCGNIEIKKTICMVQGENTTLIRYEILQAPQSFTLKMKPFLAFRDYHHLSKANDHIREEVKFENGTLCVRPYDGIPPLYIRVQGANFQTTPDWYFNYHYESEMERGLEFKEDLFTHGDFYLTVQKGDVFFVHLSTEDPHGKKDEALFKKEIQRKKDLLEPFAKKKDPIPSLILAADQFIVQRDSDLKTVIAGYHWFSDWGRDTMISLPGLTLVTKRFDDAKKIIRAFASHVDQGMIPNRFPDVGEEPEYNTVDATLWYFVAIYQYWQYTKDDAFVLDELYPILENILEWHQKGTRYHIRMDDDYLLTAGERGVQLTWMDAKVGDWVVTPREGKAVEINALWYNAMSIMHFFSGLKKAKDKALVYEDLANKIKHSFQEAFIKPSGSLYDLITPEGKDGAIRPNQVFALSLPFPLVDNATAKSILEEIEQELLTPVGLRSLSPRDPQYIGLYMGGQVSRDGAYHQGTVWSWLLGPYLTAKIKIEGAEGKKEVESLVQVFAHHLEQAGIGTVSEIFDGNLPFAPKGCMAQAWGVAEILRVLLEDLKY